MSSEHPEVWEHSEQRSGAIKIGRYLLHRQIARGGMATIHIARLMGDEGFSRIVAAKRLLPEFAEDSEFVAMFLDEARVASKVHHPNVVPVLDVVTTGEDVILVQEYVRGAPLHYLLRTAHQQTLHIPVNIAVSIACQILAGLQAAHDTVDEMGMPLNIVHRDVSPQNIMISVDGSARLLDFGVAKATMAAHTTRENTFKGKLAYSAPEQLRGAATRQSDIYAIGIVMWEMLVGRRMHHTAQSEAELVATIMAGTLPKLTDALVGEREKIGSARWRQLELLETIIKKALAVDLRERFANASEMEQALNGAVIPASPTEVSSWLKSLGKEFVEKNEAAVKAEEASWRRTAVPLGQRKITPVPGELRRPSALRMATHLESTGPGVADTSTANGAQAYPQEQQRRPNTLLYVLGGLVILLGFGIVFVMVSSTGAPPAPARQPDPPAAALPPPATPAMTVPAPAPPAAASTGAPTAAPTGAAITANPPPVPIEAPPTKALAQPQHDTQPPVHHPVVHQQPPVHQIVRQPQQPQHNNTAPTPTPTPPVAAPTPTQPPPNECNPPYYFEGSKKVFKPQCI